MGKNPISDAHDSAALFVTTMLTKDAVISDLWTLGILDPSEKKTREELHEAVKEHFLGTVKVDEDDRFIFHLPWIDDPLPDNLNLAFKRLDYTVKKLNSENLYMAYDDIFKEWERDIIEEVPKNEIDTPSHYLPHRHVVKENKQHCKNQTCF